MATPRASSHRARGSLILAGALALALPGAGPLSHAEERLPLIGASKAARDRAVEADVDRLALAALLLKDGYADRAKGVLAEVDPALPGLDLPRFYTLRGLTHARLGAYGDAAADLQAALLAGATDPEIHLYIARARLALEDRAGVIGATDAALAGGVDTPGLWLLRFHAHRGMAARPLAFEDLMEGSRRFPEDAELLKQRAFYLVELGLYQGAREVGAQYLAASSGDADAYLALAEALGRAGNPGEAQRLLEAARLRFPEDRALQIQLAQSYLSSEQALAAAEVMVHAAAQDPALMVEAAELFRRGGQLPRALFYNSLVADPKAKARQRLGFLLEAGAFEQAVALAPRLGRLGLLEDDALLYALAYAHFQTGDLDRAEAALSGIEDPAVFKMATQLRDAMQVCRQDALSCL